MRENGRSMVEMLGVLAIIGVLSVGAISGYSKAMLKYKLNKQAEQMNQLINTTYIYGPKIDTSSSMATTGSSYIPYFKKLNLIPDGMTYANMRLKPIFPFIPVHTQTVKVIRSCI